MREINARMNNRTRTDIALSLLGIFSIESEIDFRKMTLLGQSCRNESHSWLRSGFLLRLASYNLYKSIQIGFIPDIVRILEKYSLTYYLDAFMQYDGFPNKFAWKRLVKHRIHDMEINLWQDRVSSPDFCRFRRLHWEYTPHKFWLTAYRHPHFFLYINR